LASNYVNNGSLEALVELGDEVWKGVKINGKIGFEREKNAFRLYKKAWKKK